MPSVPVVQAASAKPPTSGAITDLSSAIAAGANVFTQREDQIAAENGAATAGADADKAAKQSAAAQAKLKNDITSFSKGDIPAWFWVVMATAGAGLGLAFFIRHARNAAKRR